MPGKPSIPRACEHCSATFYVWPNWIRAGRGRFCSKSCAQRRYKSSPAHDASVSEYRSPEYAAWGNMRGRCLNPRDPGFRNYGGRGITICQAWQDSYEAFLADVGRRPSPLYSIDRINNDGNYEPSNVRWATRHEQMLSRRQTGIRLLTYNGITQSVSAWAKELGLRGNSLSKRLWLGWDAERALTTPYVPRGHRHHRLRP